MTDEAEGTAVEPFEEPPEPTWSPDNVEAYKRARDAVGRLLEERCRDTVDANNVLARLEWALRQCAHYLQEDSGMVEEAFGVGIKAFLDYSGSQSPRGTRRR